MEGMPFCVPVCGLIKVCSVVKCQEVGLEEMNGVG